MRHSAFSEFCDTLLAAEGRVKLMDVRLAKLIDWGSRPPNRLFRQMQVRFAIWFGVPLQSYSNCPGFSTAGLFDVERHGITDMQAAISSAEDVAVVDKVTLAITGFDESETLIPLLDCADHSLIPACKFVSEKYPDKLTD